MDELVRQGCLDIWVDEIVPCFRDTVTGELKYSYEWNGNEKDS